MGRGVGQCSACQPCGICGIPLKIGSIIAAIFYMLDGFATLAVILYDVTYIQNQTTPKIVDTVLIGFILFATMLWIGASILLLIGSLKRNRFLVSLFLLGIVINNLIIIIAMIVALATFTQDDYAKPRLIYYGAYGLAGMRFRGSNLSIKSPINHHLRKKHQILHLKNHRLSHLPEILSTVSDLPRVCRLKMPCTICPPS
ncbi:unnamed protein product [Allacma fusca]|uniref:Uncharacterized protein n=1 Tax=Allacma fusca TaxID=39272 RepID=A0A8J2KG58_9HEXA|nr:unnamed protein product [Allacma fusca]